MKAIRTLTLGYSPCPNDTFIFYALVHKRIKTGNLRFDEELLDIDTLNLRALKGGLDVTKVSFNAYRHLRQSYTLLSSGAALGHNCGPLIVAKKGMPAESLRGGRVAIPGRLTTAFLLLQLYDPFLAKNVVVMPFDRIMAAVRDGETEAGLIIHESRFTYPSYGLFEVMDLGRWWEDKTGLPIPLGCIIAKKELGSDIIEFVDRLVKESVKYAMGHREETKAYVKSHSREIGDSVIKRHIDLYVNNYSIDLGSDGMKAMEELFQRSADMDLPRENKNAIVR